MTRERLLLDTFFAQALLNRRDQHHEQAKAWLPRLRAAGEVWVTEAVLVEIGNALSGVARARTAAFIRDCYRTANMRVAPVDFALLNRALNLYEARADKNWGLTDCISFVVMGDQGLTDALTGDAHFRQAGFRCLFSEP